MAKDTGTITFWLRTEKKTKDDKAPIFIIFSVRGVRCYFNTGLKIYPFNWNDESKKITFIDKKKAKTFGYFNNASILLSAFDVDNINAELTDLGKKILDEEMRFKLDKVPYSSKMVIEQLKRNINPQTFKEAIQLNIPKWINLYCEKPNSDLKQGTIKGYRGLANHLIDFEDKMRIKVTFKELTISTLEAFRTFLNIEKKQTNITVAKEFSTLKTLLVKANQSEDKIDVNPDYQKFKNYPRDDANFEIIALNINELATIINYDFSDNLKLDKQKDVFLFSCFTGLRYSDLKDLDRVHIVSDKSMNWIRKTCMKTNKPLSIPLDETCLNILEKYKNDLQPLPIISNNKCSQYLKEIAKHCNLNRQIVKERKVGKEIVRKTPKLHEAISIHTGRKTFVTTLLDSGNTSRDVMALTGQSSVKVMRRYDNYAEENKVNAIELGFSKIKELVK